mmetsp:Transcript_54226/g.126610  ORF Transcript_54226/g.126610 Transcript_54226/m.126610 type:complete len:173 (+) Transcript_54226:8003-8521(+)
MPPGQTPPMRHVPAGFVWKRIRTNAAPCERLVPPLIVQIHFGFRIQMLLWMWGLVAASAKETTARGNQMARLVACSGRIALMQLAAPASLCVWVEDNGCAPMILVLQMSTMASAARKQVLAMIMTVQTLTCYGRMPLPIPAPASRARTSTKGLVVFPKIDANPSCAPLATFR